MHTPNLVAQFRLILVEAMGALEILYLVLLLGTHIQEKDKVAQRGLLGILMEPYMQEAEAVLAKAVAILHIQIINQLQQVQEEVKEAAVKAQEKTVVRYTIQQLVQQTLAEAGVVVAQIIIAIMAAPVDRAWC